MSAARRLVIRLVVAALAIASPVGADAQSASLDESDVAQARELFRVGVEHLRAERWEEACRAFLRSGALVETAQAHLNTAACSGRLGRLLDQSEHLRAFLRLAGPEVEPERIAEARRTLEAIEPRIPRLALRITGAGDGDVRVRVEDREIPRIAWDAPRPVNPGRVSVRVTGAEVLSLERAISIAEGETVTVELAIEQRPVAPPGVASAASSVRDATAAIEQAPRGGDDAWVWVIVLTSVALAGAAAAIIGYLVHEEERTVERAEFPPGTLRFDALVATF